MTKTVPRIVIEPSAVGELILDPSAHPILHAWRDGELQPVVSRELLVRYLRLLKRLGMPPRTVRWWAWWLGSPEKVLIVHDPDPVPGLPELCRTLAREAQAMAVVHRTGHPPQVPSELADALPWLDPQALVQQLKLCSD